MITPIILSGGSGTRLWPLSRKSAPKQFISIFDEESLFEKTVNRVRDEKLFGKPFAICNSDHRFMVAEKLQQSRVTPSAIMLEPVGRNTAPAITAAAIEVINQAKSLDGAGDIMLVMPSDHLITNQEAFIEATKRGKKLAEEGYLVTFGIIPNRPETGYGYIKKGDTINNFANRVDYFAEKPDEAKAKVFVDSGEFLWNSGIFMFKASTYLDNVGKYAPEVLNNCNESYEKAVKDLDFIRLDGDSFAKCPDISIDYAVMEKAENIAVVPVDMGWSDVGSWNAIADLSKQDESGNTVKGEAILKKTANCYIRNEMGLIATIGLKDLIIVNSKDVTLVAHKDCSQDVKNIVSELKINNKDLQI